MKKILFFILFYFTFLLTISINVPSSAVETNRIYLSSEPCENGELIPISAVATYQRGRQKYIFLPGGTDLKQIRIWFTGTDRIIVDNEEKVSGDILCDLTDRESIHIVWKTKEFDIKLMKGSAVGALFINTESGGMKKVDKSKKVKESGQAFFLAPNGTVQYHGRMKHIKLRGNSSAVMSKKNYNICLETNADLMGMGKAKHWVLLGSSRDRSQIRNQIVYEMARYVGLPYTPDCRQIDLYFNHEYNGTYLICEKIEIHPERVNVRNLGTANEKVNHNPLDSYKRSYGKIGKTEYKAYDLEMNPIDITGGYIIEYENYTPRYNSELCALKTKRNKVLLIKEPEYASTEEMKYISRFMQGYEDAIFNKDGIDPVSGKHYSEFVDFTSLVLKYMLEEISMNCDGNASSQYYVKPSDSESKVAFAGPIWDYDTTFGDYARAKGQEYRLLDPEQLIHGKGGSRYWWPQLYKKQDFFSAVCKAWEYQYKPALQILLDNEEDESGVLLSVKQYAKDIENSAKMNYIRWPMYALNEESQNIARTGNTYEENLSYLISFISKRMEYLDSIWLKAK